MPELREQAVAGEREVSTLRRVMVRPEPYLAVMVLAFVLTGADAMRSPRDQITAGWYVGAVHAYQRWGRPVANRFIRCRYNPTCSEYSIRAVTKYGLAKGLVMTVRRLASCRGSVPLGTLDPVARSAPALSFQV